MPNSQGGKAAFYVQCPTCDPIHYETQLWLSYREGVDYDKDLPPEYKNKVFIYICIYVYNDTNRLNHELFFILICLGPALASHRGRWQPHH